MEYKVEYIYNGKKNTYYVSFENIKNLTSNDILLSIQMELKRFLRYNYLTDTLQILSCIPLNKK